MASAWLYSQSPALQLVCGLSHLDGIQYVLRL